MIKDFTIRHLAARIANDAIQHATALAQLDILKHQKEVEENGAIKEEKTTNQHESEETGSDTKTAVTTVTTV